MRQKGAHRVLVRPTVPRVLLTSGAKELLVEPACAPLDHLAEKRSSSTIRAVYAELAAGRRCTQRRSCAAIAIAAPAELSST